MYFDRQRRRRGPGGPELRLTSAGAALVAMAVIFWVAPAGSQNYPLRAADVGLKAWKLGRWGFDLEGMDRKILPGDDFFSYANGRAYAAMEISPDKIRFGSIDSLIILSENRVRALIAKAVSEPQRRGSDESKIAQIYAGYLDRARVEAQGDEPVRPGLERLRSGTTASELIVGPNALLPVSGAYPVLLTVEQDGRNPTRNAVYVSQSGLLLPTRDYYSGDGFAAQRSAAEAYARQLLAAAGWQEPERRAAELLAFESKVAEASWSAVDSRDFNKTYNPVTTGDLGRQFPGLPWREVLAGSGLEGSDRPFIIRQPTAVARIARLYSETPLETLKAWHAVHLLDVYAPFLSTPFSSSYWTFQKVRSAIQARPDDRQRAYALVDRIMGDALGRLYVRDYYDAAATEPKVRAIFDDVRSALATRIRRSPFLGEATKAEALRKLAELRLQVGRPKRWTDYSGLAVETSPARNIAHSIDFEWKRSLERLHRPIDRDRWLDAPHMAIASYSQERNLVTLAAGTLLPPFFDPEADDAVNYGGIGGTLAHEIIHGFDNRGRQSDSQSRLRNWWTPEDDARFVKAAATLRRQYDQYEPIAGRHVDGERTLSENIADLGGLTLALEAYRRSHGRGGPRLNGFSGEQRVFLGWAQIWRTKVTEPGMRAWLATRVHSPAQYRVNGIVRNIDDWYRLFSVKPGDKLYLRPEDRVRIW